MIQKAYRVHRTELSATGRTDISRSDVEQYLANAPLPPSAGNKRYPKKFKNTENIIQNPHGIALSEYPTKNYPYNQNSKGKAHRRSPGGTQYEVDPGYIRTITDDQKNIQGVIHHPFNDHHSHVRAEEIRRRRRRG